jgi:hypothetical protein
MTAIHFPPANIPLRLTSRRFWLWGLVLAVFSTVVIANSPRINFVDYPQFWAAGRTVGTADLLDRASHGAWMAAHGVIPDLFPYPPGTAWLFAPFAAFSVAFGFWLHAIVMTGFVAIAGLVGARVYGLDGRVGVMMAFAWGPSMASVAFGQNGPFALVLALLAIEGLRRDNDFMAGLGVALLMYKPTLAIPLLGLMLLRRRWGALGFAALGAGGWYLASVAATAGDWLWPLHLVGALTNYYPDNTVFNVGKSSSIPGVLLGYGVPAVLAWGLSAAVVVAAIPRLLRAPLVEAGAGACLIGLAVSPHSLNYEAVMVLPIVMWALGATGAGIAEPARTRLIVAAFVLASMHLISTYLGLSSLAIVTLGATAIWLTGWRRADAGTAAGTPAGAEVGVAPA